MRATPPVAHQPRRAGDSVWYGREAGRGPLQQIIRPPQLTVLPLQTLGVFLELSALGSPWQLATSSFIAVLSVGADTISTGPQV